MADAAVRAVGCGCGTSLECEGYGLVCGCLCALVGLESYGVGQCGICVFGDVHAGLLFVWGGLGRGVSECNLEFSGGQVRSAQVRGKGVA